MKFPLLAPPTVGPESAQGRERTIFLVLPARYISPCAEACRKNWADDESRGIYSNLVRDAPHFPQA